MVLSSFLGVLLIAVPEVGVSAPGDKMPYTDIIIGDGYANTTKIVKNGMWQLDGNLTIRAGGVVEMINSIMYFRSDYSGNIPIGAGVRALTLTIEDGGILILENSTLTIQPNVDLQHHPLPALGVVVRHDGLLEARNSTISYSGHLFVDDASFTLIDSTVSGLDKSTLVGCNTTYFPDQVFSSAPVMLFMSSDVTMIGSTIQNLYENITNSVEFNSIQNPGIYSNSFTFAKDTHDRTYVDYFLERDVNAVFGAGSTVSGNPLYMTTNNTQNVTVQPGQRLNTTGFDMGGLIFNPADIESIVLNVRYSTDPTFSLTGTPDAFWNTTLFGTPAKTPITVTPNYQSYNPASTNKNVTESYRIPASMLVNMSAQNLGKLALNFTNSKNSNVYIDRIWVTIDMKLWTYRNMTIGGSTNLIAADSSFDLNNIDEFQPHSLNATNGAYHKFVALDQSIANLYGVKVRKSTGGDTGTPVFKTSNLAKVTTANGTNDLAGQSASKLFAVDGNFYNVANGQTMIINKYDIGELTGSIKSLTASFVYLVEIGTYTGTNYIQYSIDGSPFKNTSMSVQTLAFQTTIGPFDLYANGVTSINKLKTLTFSFTNNGGATVNFDKFYLNIETQPEVALYRWESLNVTDAQSLPVSNVGVSSTTLDANENAYYLDQVGRINTPPQAILDYLGRDATNYNRTGSYGYAKIPFLTDILNSTNVLNGNSFVGNYNMIFRYRNATQELFVLDDGTATAFHQFPNMVANVDTRKVTFPGLFLDKPSFRLAGLDVTPNPLYVNTMATLNVTVYNDGLTAARDIQVSFYDGNVLISNVTIPTLLNQSHQDVNVQWLANVTGDHIIKVVVDPDHKIIVAERSNNVIAIPLVVHAHLPDLTISSSDISFSRNPAFTEIPLWINATVHNNGTAPARNITVSYYANAVSDQNLIGADLIDVTDGSSAVASIVWVPTELGNNYSIIVVVNQDRSVEEVFYNNQASADLVVLLSTTNAHVLSGYEYLNISGSMPFQLDGNIIVTGHAKLIISSGTLELLNQDPYQFKILVNESGSLEIISGTLTATNLMRVYLFDNATLTVRNGSIMTEQVSVVNDDHSKVTLSNTDYISSEFIAPASSFGNLTATNVTFLTGLTQFGGHATAVLTNVSMPSISLQGEARAWHYRWLTVTVMDGTTVHGIPDSYVEVDRYYPSQKYATAITGANGVALFWLLSDTINASGSRYFGNYKVNATYRFNGVAYQSSGELNGQYVPVSLQPRIVMGGPIVHNNVAVDVVIPTALPELDPPFWVSNDNPARGMVVNLTTNITNNGVVTAFDVLVRFTDLTVSSNPIIADVTIPTIAPGQHVNVTVQWTAIYPVGIHTLNVTVDPFEAIPQPSRSNNYNQTTVTVWGVPDLTISPGRITVVPAIPVTNTTVTIRADIINDGDNMAPDQTALVTFYDIFHGSRIIGNFTLPAISSGQTGIAEITWENMWPGNHNITVVIDEPNDMLEASKANNQASIIVKVLNYPNLVATNLQFKSTTGTVITQAYIDDSVTLTATVMNTGESVASDFLVRFWLGNATTGTKISDVVVPKIDSGVTTDISTIWTASLIQGAGRNQTRMVTVEVNPETNNTLYWIPVVSHTQNIKDKTLLVIDNRADLWFPDGVLVKPSGGTNSTSQAVQGQTIDISFTMENQGIVSANGAVLDIYVRDSDNFTRFLMSTTKNMIGGASIQISFPWIVNVTAGTYTLVVEMNPRHVIEESNYTNNVDSRNFTINLPDPLITIGVGAKTDFQPGASINVYGTITNIVGNYALANQPVTIKLLDAGGLAVGQPVQTTTNSNGEYNNYIFVPTDRSGQHTISVTLNTGQGYTQNLNVNIVEIFKPQSVSIWIFVIIAVIVLLVILVFSVYLYKYGLGKMVECGECGSLIPESSKRCPRCGTEFEADTAKCSECGTWIPAKSKECPECGAKFMTEPVEEISEDDYMASMRKQYEEYVNGFREQAKAALGKKYSEDKFMDWLKTEPAYLTFEAWQVKQEEGRKIGSFTCPSCGTLNPKGAAICSKCGTVFDKAPEALAQTGEAAEQAKPFRKIVKRSSERKMIPKKVVKDSPEQPEQPDQPAEQPPVEEEKKE